jgi:hypothetical protein
MMQETLTHFSWPGLSVLALLIFFSFFLGVLIRVNLPKEARALQSAAFLPLSEPERADTSPIDGPNTGAHRHE